MLVGHCMYVRYASLLHHPMALSNHVGRPVTAAVVAAPILKLWLASGSVRNQQVEEGYGELLSAVSVKGDRSGLHDTVVQF